MTYSEDIRSITIMSVKGNTTGIIDYLNEEDFKHFGIINNRSYDPSIAWKESSTILLGTSSYQRSDEIYPDIPRQLKFYENELSKIEGKDIILFGSGRSEFYLYCGALDRLNQILKPNNNIKLIYEFEGYPKESQKIEFKNLVEDIIK